ncbi:YebC/PmpR family DNA-binding transcriptional regulator [Heliobacterium gestii]|uniref:Probable transcriptional regulatory protein GTO89_15385 n=1 Tax=Heliomicrobium gestii TaxID=2699 RepID=A0A845LG67_HELGE|nr:YebC/PmpR family DNA-binding transcriptional regulator [Heliomicrobium gestii]MBM7868055.1 YebC/PmpR family DNA-binding regulatory protein [Heliomicrobium gestii]MZP44414.1 YebC/PmpR family DNA-binding transcriptional regulator [Heliomicrobium gestii]
MSGHSKWANIKHKKAKVDAQKGKVFTKVGRELIVAARQGGADPNSNFRLKIAIQKAKENNMPNDNIQRAIQRGAGGAEGTNYEELTYEGYGPGGVAIMIEAMTDNRNRTAGEIRHLFSKSGGNLGETGCVSWIFEPKGVIRLDASPEASGKAVEEDELMLVALDSGALDIAMEEDEAEVYTLPEELETVRQALVDAGYALLSAESTLVPQNTMEVTDKEVAAKLIKLMDALEDHDDVQNAYANFDIDDDMMDQIG